MIIPILTRRSYDFSATTGAAVENVVVRDLDVIAYRSATLLTRVHAMDAATSRLSISVYRTSPSPDAPQEDFIGSSALSTKQIQSETANSLVRQPLAAPFGSHLRIVLVPDPPALPATFTATLSMAMVLREQP